MIPIALTIIVAVWVGLSAEHRFPGRAGEGSRRALTFALYGILPPVVFLNLARADLDYNFAVGIALGWVVVGICTLIAFLVASRLLDLQRREIGAVLCCILVANTAYLGYPLVGATLGFDRIGEAVAFDIALSTPMLLIGAFSVGAAFGDRAGEGTWERTRAFFTRNVPLYAGIAGLIAPASLAPDIAVDISRVVIVLLLPLGFFAVGAALAEDEEQGEVRLPPKLTPPIATAVVCKIMLMPVLLYLAALPLIDLPDSFLLLAAMPSGLNSMIVVHAYGLDLKITAGALVWTTALVVPVALVASLL